MATVFDTILLSNEDPFTGKVIFRMDPAPRFRVTDIATKADITVEASTAGFVSTKLVGGTYNVSIGVSPTFKIRVPANESAYLLRDLREDLYGDGTFSPVPSDPGEVGYNYRFSEDVFTLLNATTGRHHAIYLTEVPEVGSNVTIGAENNPGSEVVSKIEGSSFLLRNFDTGDYQTIYVTGESPNFALAVSDPLEPLDNNYRYEDGRWQVLNPDTGLYHTIFITGSGTSVSISISEGQA